VTLMGTVTLENLVLRKVAIMAEVGKGRTDLHIASLMCRCDNGESFPFLILLRLPSVLIHNTHAFIVARSIKQ
jgi:hypothetical protein